jgi:hypothetical protein
MTIEGALLEMIVYFDAFDSNKFDDVKNNFIFNWINQGAFTDRKENSASQGNTFALPNSGRQAMKKPTVNNEIDIVLSKGLTTIFVSCKCGLPHQDYLFQIKYLADRFGINGKAVIVCSMPKGTHYAAFAERASMMGVHLINADTIRNDEIVKELEKVANKTVYY